MMKSLLIAALALSLVACGAKDKVQQAVTETLGGAPESAADAVPSDEELGEALEEAKDWAHAQGWDGEGYQFPQVEDIRAWPPAEVWTELGLPELKPESMTEDNIYNDGSTHIDGYSDCFVAECSTGEDSFDTLAQTLWDAGIKGVNIGGGRIIPAEEMDWLIDDDPNYLWYRAYYEYEGDLLEVYLQYTNGWDDTLWVGVVYAPSDPDFEQYPQMSWPAAELKAIIGVDLPNPGGTVYGVVNRDGYAGAELVIEGVSQADCDAYVQALKDGKAHGILKDEGDMSSDIYGYYSSCFYSEDYENYPVYIDINYVGGVMLITVINLS